MKAARKLIAKLFIFILPILLFFLPAILSGEMINSGWIAEMQVGDNKQMMYGPLYAEHAYWYYKAEATRLAAPNILILGDSRALQMRGAFFRDDLRVYNAGYSVINTADMQYFLEAQNTKEIDVVIITLNHFSFNLNYADVQYPTHSRYTDSLSGNGLNYKGIASTFLSVIKPEEGTPLRTLQSWARSLEKQGLNAKRNDKGMLNDGSMFYGDTYYQADNGTKNTVDRMADTLDRIENAGNRFEYGDHANPNALYYLRQFLQYCEDNKIYVIAFTPPYAPSVNHAMQEKGSAYNYQYEMLEMIPLIFDEYGFEFYDYTDVSDLGCTDDYFLDGFHGSDVVFLRMTIDMIENGSRINELCDVSTLLDYDLERFSDLRIFEMWEDYY